MRVRIGAGAALALALLSACSSSVAGSGHAGGTGTPAASTPAASTPLGAPTSSAPAPTSTTPTSTSPSSTSPSSTSPTSTSPTSTSPSSTGPSPTSPSPSTPASPPPTDPGPPPTVAPVSGAIVESHRIGLFAVPFDKVLPGAGTSCFERGAWPTPKAAAGGVLAETFSEDNNTSREQTLADAGYTGGFVTCGGPKKSQTGGLVMLMETHDEVRAKVMINKLFISLGGLGGKTGKVPGFPDARVIVKKTAGTYYLDAWVSSGRMVTYVAMNSTKEQDALATTGKAFAAQQPLTAKFVPTDYDADPQAVEDQRGLPPRRPQQRHRQGQHLDQPHPDP